MSFFTRKDESIHGDDIENLAIISNDHKHFVEYPENKKNIYGFSKRKEYLKHVNDWLDQPDLYYLSRLQEKRKNEGFNTDDINEDNIIHHSTVLFSMYKEILDVIEKHNCEIYNTKQFKEDFIHYIYTVSKL